MFSALSIYSDKPVTHLTRPEPEAATEQNALAACHKSPSPPLISVVRRCHSGYNSSMSSQLAYAAAKPEVLTDQRREREKRKT